MDNNNPKPILNQVSQSTTPLQPNSTPLPPSLPPLKSSERGSKIMLWLVLGLIVIGVVVAGVYWFLSQQSAIPSVQQTYNKPVTQKGENLDADLNSIDVKNIDSDFASVDQDLQSL